MRRRGARQIDGLGEGPVLQRIVERHRLGARLRKAIGEPRRERVVGQRVGPQAEHAAGAELRGQPAQAVGLIEAGMARIEQAVGRMIDVDQHRVEAAAGRVRIEARLGGGQREEVAMDEAAARVGGDRGAERHQSAPVPIDDGASASTTTSDPTWAFSSTAAAV